MVAGKVVVTVARVVVRTDDSEMSVTVKVFVPVVDETTVVGTVTVAVDVSVDVAWITNESAAVVGVLG